MLTQRQHQLLRFIHDYVGQQGVPPSFEEMREALNLKSKSGIHRLITGLEERGYIGRLRYRARAIEVLRVPPGWQREADESGVDAGAGNVVRGRFNSESGLRIGAAGRSRYVPFFGRIAAGTPIEALCDQNSQIDVPSSLLGEGEHYVLEVVGDSMIDAGIHDGDSVVIQLCSTAESGAIVVALIDDREVTLKRLRRKGASVALEAANANYETRIFGPNRVKVQGRLVGLIRSY